MPKPPALDCRREPDQPRSAPKADLAPASRPRSWWGKKSWWWLLLSASILLTLAVPLLLGGLAPFKKLRGLEWWVALLLALLALTSWWFNAWRTRFLMASLGRRVSWRQALATTIAAEFAGVTTPGAVGMAPTYTLLFHNLGLSLGEAVGLVGIIVVTDLTYFGTIMPVAAIFAVFEGTARQYTLTLMGIIMGVVLGSALVLLALVRNYRRVYRWVSRNMARFSWLARRRYRLARGVVHLIRSWRALSRMSAWQLLGLYLITLGFWLPRYLVLVAVIYLLAHGGVPFSYLVLVQGVLNLGGQIFLLPGGGGAVDAGYAAFLGSYLPRESLAFTLLVWRTYNFYWFLLVGGPIFLLRTGKAAHDLLAGKDRRRGLTDRSRR